MHMVVWMSANKMAMKISSLAQGTRPRRIGAECQHEVDNQEGPAVRLDHPNSDVSPRD